MFSKIQLLEIVPQQVYLLVNCSERVKIFTVVC